MDFSGFVHMDLVNWPGKVACTVFTAGCNLRCPYCHNASLVLEDCSEIHTEDEILSFLKTRVWMRHLVVSGGEPTIQPGLRPFLEKVKALGVSVKLDTNGTRPEIVRDLVRDRLVDFVALDLKAPAGKYSLVGGERFEERIRETLEFLRSSRVKKELRTTCSKNMLSRDDILSCILDSGRMPLYLQVFDPHETLDPEWRNAQPWTAGELEEIARPFDNVFVR